ncbi:MAG: hypothetical protein Q7T55_01830 [Solirubrobacteraceae bacterium]|nr:hypothetical protein [Solirubrobacteraceae bacterium]
MQLPGAEQESATAAIERLRREPGGVLIQTTHWQERLTRSLFLVFVVLAALLLTEGVGADARERAITLGVVGGPILLLLAYWTYVRGRSGLVARGDTLEAKGAFSRRERIDPEVVLEEGEFPSLSRSMFAEYRGFLKPGSRWQTVPGLAVRAGVTGWPGALYRPGELVGGSHRVATLMTRRPSRLMTRPMRSWYRIPARATIHEDVVWEPGDDGRAVRLAVGLAAAPVRSERPEFGTANRLEGWDRKAA